MALPRWADILLRLEWLAVLAAALVVYGFAGGSWLLFAILILAPDLSMLGYLAGSRAGGLAYNAVHTLVVPALLGMVALLAQNQIALEIALIWTAHIAADRALGYGLKLSSFQDTHLGRVGREHAK